MRRTRPALTALLLAPALLVAGCSAGDPDPVFEEPPASGASEASDSPSTSPASGPPEPQLPAAARGTDAGAAKAFVKHYWAMVNYAQATGDVDGLETLGSTQCAACAAGIKSLRQIYDSGGRVIGGQGEVSNSQVGFIERRGKTNAVVEFDVSSTKQTVDYPGTNQDQVVPAGKVALRAVLEPTSAGWTISFWGER